MNTLSSVFGYGLDYVKAYKFPGLSTLIPFWPFSKGEAFKDEIPDPAEEDAEEDVKEKEEKEEKEEAFEEDTGTLSTSSLTKDVDPVLKSIINTILYYLYYVFIFILASIIANDLIYAHWGVRLFTFCFVIYLCYGDYPTVIYPISIYYIINALYNIFMNYRDKPLDPVARKAWHPRPLLPRRYAFLPIITSRNSGVLDLLNPFSYFPLGDDPKDPKYANYTYDAEKYKEDLNIVIPDFVKYKDQFLGTLLKKFTVYFAELNKPFIKYKGPDSLDESPSSEELKNNALKAMATTKDVKEQVKGAIVTATGLEESAKYIAQALKPT